jgi:hypothetical protein
MSFLFHGAIAAHVLPFAGLRAGWHSARSAAALWRPTGSGRMSNPGSCSIPNDGTTASHGRVRSGRCPASETGNYALLSSKSRAGTDAPCNINSGKRRDRWFEPGGRYRNRNYAFVTVQCVFREPDSDLVTWPCRAVGRLPPANPGELVPSGGYSSRRRR